MCKTDEVDLDDCYEAVMDESVIMKFTEELSEWMPKDEMIKKKRETVTQD